MKTTILLIVFVLLGALLLAGCSSSSAQTVEVPDGAQAGELTLLEQCEYQPADSKTKYAAERGSLVVPENW